MAHYKDTRTNVNNTLSVAKVDTGLCFDVYNPTSGKGLDCTLGRNDVRLLQLQLHAHLANMPSPNCKLRTDGELIGYDDENTLIICSDFMKAALGHYEDNESHLTRSTFSLPPKEYVLTVSMPSDGEPVDWDILWKITTRELPGDIEITRGWVPLRHNDMVVGRFQAGNTPAAINVETYLELTDMINKQLKSSEWEEGWSLYVSLKEVK